MPGAVRADWIAAEPRQLGKYELIRRLATGGMAEIYLARAAAIEGFEKFVVLKRILPQHAENEGFIRMFLAEARLAATLHHPNIVQVYDIGENDGAYFFAMEYVQGLDLRQLFNDARRAERTLPLQHILHIITGVCAGLHYAHEKKDPGGTPLGIVHRDISPSNVLVTFDGGVKVVDFGIAKAANVSTTAGTLKGKIPYMSPEQCRTQPLDRRSDVFSIGTLLWELTVGRKLFQADNELALLGVVAKGEITPPSEVRPDYPPALEAIVLKALETDLEARWQTAQELQLALEDFAHEARLPLSSARLQPFLADVCADRIAKVEGLLAAHHDGSSGEPEARGEPDDDAPEAQTALFSSAGPSGTPGPTPPVAEATEPGQAAAFELTSAPVTTVAAAPAPVPAPSTAPRRLLVLAAGVGAVFGLVLAAAWVLMPSGKAPTSEPATTPATAVPERSDMPTPAPAVAPTPEAPPPAAPAEPEAVAEPETVAEPEATATPAEPDPSASPSPRPRTKRDRPSGSKRSTSRPSSGKSNDSAPSKESKPKWDPKAAPPPGL